MQMLYRKLPGSCFTPLLLDQQHTLHLLTPPFHSLIHPSGQSVNKHFTFNLCCLSCGLTVVVLVVEGERKNDFLAYSLEAGKNYCHSVK